MDIEGRRRSENFEDRGGSSGGGRMAGGLPLSLLSAVVGRLGLKGTLVLAAVAGVGYLIAPDSIKQLLFGAVGAPALAPSAAGGGSSTCRASESNAQACDFARAVLASTEDVWRGAFTQGALPRYGEPVDRYADPTLVVFSNQVSTACGNADSGVGPFYCPADRKLYLDPSFYRVMTERLKAPGDFAQAYVIAHEVGHHVQNLIGSSQRTVSGETKNQVSVRVELQADCFAGVWGHTARANLAIDESDLSEALTAAHAIGDDSLGHSNAAEFTHGTSAQRVRWFRRGFESGDARQCDTFAVKRSEL